MSNRQRLFAVASAFALTMVIPVQAAAEAKVTNLGGLLGGYSATATAINNAGTIVGYSNSRRGPRGVRWTRDGAITDLDALPGESTFSYANGINRSGIIVGKSLGHAVRWGVDGTISILASLPGYSDNRAQAINDSGVIAGSVWDPESGRQRAVRWNLDGTVTDLGTLTDDRSSAAYGINDTNVIVGESSRITGGVRPVA